MCATGAYPSVFTLSFMPRAGTTSTLAPLDGVDLLYQGGVVVDSNTGTPFDSIQYKLTTLDNYQYIIQSSDGANTFQIVQITDPNGEVLSITKSGVTSSNGAAIQFTRDAQGRITTNSASRAFNVPDHVGNGRQEPLFARGLTRTRPDCRHRIDKHCSVGLSRTLQPSSELSPHDAAYSLGYIPPHNFRH